MAECLSQYLCNQLIMESINDDCENPMFSGMNEGAYLFNFNSINKSACEFNADNPRMIENLALNDGENGFYIINARTNPYTGTNTTVEVGDYRNTFTRTVSLFVPMDGATVSKTILDPLANGRFVVILRNNYVNTNGDNEFQVYGFDRGLVVSSMTQTKYENNDYWVVELQEAGVPNSGRFFDHQNWQIYDGSMSFTLVENNIYHIELKDAANNVIAIQDKAIGTVGDEYTGVAAYFKVDGVEYQGVFTTPRVIGTADNFNADKVMTNTTTEKYLCNLVDGNIQGYTAYADYVSDGNYRIGIYFNNIAVGDTTYNFGTEGDAITTPMFISVMIGSTAFALRIDSATTVGQAIEIGEVFVAE